MTAKALTASLEDYLEAIYQIAAEKRVARAKDISERLKVNSSSVTGALHALAGKDLVNYAPYDLITLTPKGSRVAENVILRHEALRDFFEKVLGVEKVEAEETACRMEHGLSTAVLERFVHFIDFMEVCPRGGLQWIQELGYPCRHWRTGEDCETCVQDVLRLAAKRREEPPLKGASSFDQG